MFARVATACFGRDLYDQHMTRHHFESPIGLHGETKGLRKDGSTFPIDLTVSAAQPERVFAVIVRDVTYRESWERAREALISELEDKNGELERFAYTASHELKTPLTTMRVYVEQARRDLGVGRTDRADDDLARVSKAGDKMKRPLEELLALSRIGRVTSPPSDVPMDELVREAVEITAGSPGGGRGESSASWSVWSLAVRAR